MTTQSPHSRIERNLARLLAAVTLALLSVAGLCAASVWQPPIAAPLHALHAPASESPQTPDSKAISGTLAAFTALIPEFVSVYVPVIVR
jgi:hypothetical protein